MNAADLLQQGADTIRQRAQFRDTPGGEYAMPLAVRLMQAYNGGRLESDVDGNVFMVFLKLARHQNGGKLNMDDFIDGAAYMAMAGEAAAGGQPKEVLVPNSGIAANVEAVVARQPWFNSAHTAPYGRDM